MTTPDRLTLAAAVAVALASSALTPVYQDLRWLPYMLGAVVAVGSASALARLAQAPQALQRTAGLLALAGSVTLTFAGSTLLYGVLPTWTTVIFLSALVASGLEDARTLASPVPTSSGLVLLAVLGTGAIAVLVDLLAVRLRQVVVSGLPLLLLFAVPSAVQRGELGVLPFLLGAAGWLGLLLADSSDQVRQWGPPLRGARASSSSPSKHLSVGRVGQRIGAAALGVAALVPALVPGLDGRLVGGGGAGDSARHPVTYTPMTELVGRLRETKPRQLLTYRSTAGPVPLRYSTLDVYDREQGTFSPSEPAFDHDAEQDGVLTPPGRTAPTDPFDIEVALTEGQLGGLRLPIPATPTDIDVEGSWSWSWDAQAETVFSTRTTLLYVRSYEIRAARVRADAALLRRRQTVPADIMQVYAKDPELSDDASALLDRTTDGLLNDFDRVNAVQRLLRETDFVYTEETAPAPSGSPDALTAFLQNRRGFCEQYAPAMAALVRGLGIPARVAMGFTGGTRIGPNQYEVTTRHAHAWPEVWFQGAGWVAFEPTPRDNDVQVDAPAYSLVPPLDAATDGAGSSPAPSAPPPAGRAGPDQRDRAVDSGSASQGSHLEQDRSDWWLVLPAAAALAAGRRDRAAAEKGGEGPLGVQSVWVVAADDEQGAGGVWADAVLGDQSTFTSWSARCRASAAP